MWVRRAVVAGRFYPGEAPELVDQIRRALDAANVPPDLEPKALIVPHAGYAYSAPIAASGYTALGSRAGEIDRVVLLGTCHSAGEEGLAATRAAAFETPLGVVEVDAIGNRQALTIPGVRIDDEAHGRDHALEVQLPFLQVVLRTFRIVPLLAGPDSARAVSDVLDTLWDGPTTLIVVSSDLSHYLAQAEAARVDRVTANAIERLDGDALRPRSACGREAIAGLLRSAKRHGLSCRTLDLRSSGDTSGRGDRVVGYGAFAFYSGADADRCSSVLRRPP